MKLPTIRLVCLDLDGTLLNHEHQLGTVNRQAIERCLAQGTQVMLASGRLYQSIALFAQDIGLSGPQIALNGGLVVECPSQKIHAIDRLSPQRIDQIVAILDAHGLESQVFTAHGIVTRPDAKGIELISSFGEPPPEIRPVLRGAEIIDPVKVLTLLEPGPLDQELAKAMGPEICTIRTGQYFLEFMTPGISKGHALAAIMAESGLSKDQVIAMGDNDNDVSMFQVAGHSVAMDNATPAAKAAARYHSGHHHHDHGVAQALERYVLL
jgi:Cof subfamily protein (haloacid dehalogenase superfamily)